MSVFLCTATIPTSLASNPSVATVQVTPGIQTGAPVFVPFHISASGSVLVASSPSTALTLFPESAFLSPHSASILQTCRLSLAAPGTTNTIVFWHSVLSQFSPASPVTTWSARSPLGPSVAFAVFSPLLPIFQPPTTRRIPEATLAWSTLLLAFAPLASVPASLPLPKLVTAHHPPLLPPARPNTRLITFPLRAWANGRSPPRPPCPSRTTSTLFRLSRRSTSPKQIVSLPILLGHRVNQLP